MDFGQPIDLGTAPIAQPPPGVTSNFVDGPSQAYRYTITISVLLVLSTILLALRLFTRVKIIHASGTEDYLLIAAWMLMVASAALGADLYKYGFGQPAYDVPLSHLSPFILRNWIASNLYFVIICFIKVSILILFLRISLYRTYQILIWAIMFVVVASNLSGILVNLLICQPISKTWSLTLQNSGHCNSGLPGLLVNGIINILTDVIMIIFPIPLLWTLALPIRQKVGIVLILMTGSSVAVVSIIRLVITVPVFSSSNFESIITVSIGSTVETHVGLICACLASLKPFLKRYARNMIDASGQRSLRTHHAPQNDAQSPDVEIGPIKGSGGSAGFTGNESQQINTNATNTTQDGHVDNGVNEKDTIPSSAGETTGAGQARLANKKTNNGEDPFGTPEGSDPHRHITGLMDGEDDTLGILPLQLHE